MAISTSPDSTTLPCGGISELLPKILQTIPYQVFWKDRQSNYLGCNDVFALNAGLRGADQIIGLSDFDLPWTHEEAESYRADDREVMESGNAKLHIVESQLNGCGERTWLDTSKVPLRNSNGEVIGVLGIYANITEQRMAQEQLTTTRQYLEDAIEAIDAGLVMYDAQDRLVFCNQRYAELFDFEPSSLRAGMSYRQILWNYIDTHPEFAATTDCDAWVSTRLERYRNSTTPYEQQVMDRVILISDRPTRDGGRVGLRTDISHLKAIESDLRVAKDQAEAANQSKTGFLANMSHEIRTPMTAILGFTDVLLEGECNSEQASMLHTIKRNGEHLLSLINDMLDLSKIEAGKVEVSRERVDVVAICRDVVQSLMWKAREKEITFELNTETPIPRTIWTDSVRIRQIILNLCGNAIKFTDNGVVNLTVRVQNTGPERRLLFEVRDTGIGMTAEECQRVFKPFEQADDSTTRRYGGTGLGLTISRRLATLLGGTLELESTQGGGSLFTCCLPLEIADDASIETTGFAVPRCGTKPDGLLDQMEILLAEDGPDNQRLISHVLRKAGAVVAVVNNGEEVIRAIEAREKEGGQFQLVLMDMQMPVRDGYSATREIVQRWPSLPVAAITAHTMSTDREACLKAGCCAYLSKPIDRKELIETCAHLGNVT